MGESDRIELEKPVPLNQESLWTVPFPEGQRWRNNDFTRDGGERSGYLLTGTCAHVHEDNVGDDNNDTGPTLPISFFFQTAYKRRHSLMSSEYTR